MKKYLTAVFQRNARAWSHFMKKTQEVRPKRSGALAEKRSGTVKNCCMQGIFLLKANLN